MSTPRNPKQEGSNVCDAVPQKGPCPIGCNQCFYNRPNAFYTDIAEPLMPTLEEVGDKIVRVNSGNDSNNDKQFVIDSTAMYKKRFFNTSQPYVDFPDPVVLTANPDEEEWYLAPGSPEFLNDVSNIMFVRLRVSPTNLKLIDHAIIDWTDAKVPVVLTFMRYYDQEPIGNDNQFEFKKHILNSYWCPTKDFMKEIIDKYEDNELVTTCGTLESSYCKDCGNCEKYYLEKVGEVA